MKDEMVTPKFGLLLPLTRLEAELLQTTLSLVTIAAPTVGSTPMQAVLNRLGQLLETNEGVKDIDVNARMERKRSK